MRILYLVLDPGVPLGARKGSSIHVQSITRALSGRGHRVRLLAASSESEETFAGRAECLDLPPAHRRCLRAIRETLDRNGSPSRLDRDLRALLCGAGSGARIRDRIERWRPDVVLERLSLFGTAGLRAARDAGIPHALEMNAPLAREAEEYRELSLASLARTFERDVLTGTDRVLPVSEALVDHCEAQGVDPGKIRVVPNGVDVDRFRPRGRREAARRSLGFREADSIVGMVSTLKPWHGGRDLAEAFLRIAAVEPGARLLVVGDGPERATMREALDRAGLRDRARFPGAVRHDAVPDLIEAMDVSVAPYRPPMGDYASPLKVLESLAVGCPVVASRLGQIERILSGGVGVLAPPGSPGPLADAILDLMRDPAKRDRLARASREAARERHSWDRAASEVEAALRELAGPVLPGAPDSAPLVPLPDREGREG